MSFEEDKVTTVKDLIILLLDEDMGDEVIVKDNEGAVVKKARICVRKGKPMVLIA